MKLGITTIQRDRAPWIKEWVAFHYLVGFRKFYIFTHVCKDDTEGVLAGLKKSFDIEILPTNEPDKPQIKSYQYSCDNFLKAVDWMAFIDCDEFLFPTSGDSMEIGLKKFTNKKISALGVYWVCFGSSGYIQEPSGLIIENYKKRARDGYENNRHIKSILRGGQNATCLDAHLFQTDLGTFDENLRPITYGWTDYEPTYDTFRINHYVCQSRSYYLNFKKYAGSAGVDRGYIRPESWWKEVDVNDLVDNSMDKFIGLLKDILKSI